MEHHEAIQVFHTFKGEDLKQNLNKIRTGLIGKTKAHAPDHKTVYNSALVVKELSAQVNEVVHATGILKLIPLILDDDEVIKDLSLASGADGEGIDLVTDKRIAEFKFASWQDGTPNGMRKKQVFTDFINLFLDTRPLKKELYVVDYEAVHRFLSNSKSQWRNQLSKSKTAFGKLENHILESKEEYAMVKDFFKEEKVQVFDITKLLTTL